MKISENKYAANRRYNDKTYTQLRASVRRDSRLKELVSYAADKRGISDSQYISDAVKAQLATDGITLDDLPPMPPPTPAPVEEPAEASDIPVGDPCR